MTIFHLIKYPVGDVYGIQTGIDGIAEIKKDLPELFKEWNKTYWEPYTQNDKWIKKYWELPTIDGVKVCVDIEWPIKNLRMMLLEYDVE